MPEEHAKISPSSFKRVKLCPASLTFAQQFPNEAGSAATRGTALHEAVEEGLDLNLPAPGTAMSNGYELTLNDHEDVEFIVNWIMDQGFEQLWVEQVLPVGLGLGLNDPDLCWGTSDMIGIRYEPGAELPTLYVMDAKFGFVDVDVEDNDQALLYSIGALHEFGERFHRVCNVILQPRAGGVKESFVEMDRFPKIREEAREAIKLAQSDDPPFNPGEEQCRFCPASGSCQAQIDKTLQDDFGDLTEDLQTVSNERLAEVLKKEKMIRQALDNVRSQAIQRLQAGQSIPGWKVAAGQSRARYINEQDVIDLLEQRGFDMDEVAPRKAPTQTLLRKLIGSDETEGLVERPEGKPTLKPSSDPSDSISDFEVLD
jgi:hypothetical protein